MKSLDFKSKLKRILRQLSFIVTYPYNVVVFKVTSNEVFNINGLRPKSAISLNDVIRHRTPNFAGADPTPLVEEWISDEDYSYEIDHDAQRGFRALKIRWRTKKNYIAKNWREQGTAFVTGVATVPQGVIRTRRPRGIFLPIFYLARFLSGMMH